MAFVGNESVNTNNTNREDLLDVITMISPTDTPFFTAVSKGTATATLHEWPTDVLAAAATYTVHPEGDDAVAAAVTDRVRNSNNTQIFANIFAVSMTQEKVSKAGLKSEVAYQATKKMAEHKLNIEDAILRNGAAVTGLSRTMAGAQTYISNTNATADLDITEVLLNDAIETCWNLGGKPDLVLTAAKVKRTITGFSQDSVRTLNMEQDDRRIINAIDVYESDFGVVRIVADRVMPTNIGTGSVNTYCLVLEMDRWQYMFLTSPFMEPLAKLGDSEKRWVYSEGTIAGRAPAANFKFTDVNNAVT